MGGKIIHKYFVIDELFHLKHHQTAPYVKLSRMKNYTFSLKEGHAISHGLLGTGKTALR